VRDLGFEVLATDLASGFRRRRIDFLSSQWGGPVDAIITNRPFDQATAFIERALELTNPVGFVAMLTRVDYDSAKTRQHLFGDCPQFAKKLTLTRRIVWFERPGAAPSFNHAWLIWDWRHKGPPALAYHYENP
jgi:hypothetical protein